MLSTQERRDLLAVFPDDEDPGILEEDHQDICTHCEQEPATVGLRSGDLCDVCLEQEAEQQPLYGRDGPDFVPCDRCPDDCRECSAGGHEVSSLTVVHGGDPDRQEQVCDDCWEREADLHPDCTDED